VANWTLVVCHPLFGQSRSRTHALGEVPVLFSKGEHLLPKPFSFLSFWLFVVVATFRRLTPAIPTRASCRPIPRIRQTYGSGPGTGGIGLAVSPPPTRYWTLPGNMGHLGQTGKVLVPQRGPSETRRTRALTVPTGKALFFPLVDFVF